MKLPSFVAVLASPSGTGKSSVVRALLPFEPGLRFSVSHTTRPPRPGERDGVDYHFVSRAAFETKRAEGGFLEWAEVYGDLYGTARDELDVGRSGEDGLLMEVDIQGARSLAEKLPVAVRIFLLPPDRATLEARLRGRGTEGEEAIERRLASAAAEIRAWPLFHYLVLNRSVSEAVAELRTIFAAERLRASSRRALAERIVATFPEPPR